MTGPTSAGRGASPPIAAIVIGVGGLLAIVQAVLAWEQVTVGPAIQAAGGGMLGTSAKGMEENGGKIVLALGIVAVALAAAWIMRVKIPSISVLAIVVGVLIVLVAAANWVARNNDVSDFNKQLDVLKPFVDTSGTSYSIGIGLYLAIAGGVVVVVGGILGLMKKDN